MLKFKKNPNNCIQSLLVYKAKSLEPQASAWPRICSLTVNMLKEGRRYLCYESFRGSSYLKELAFSMCFFEHTALLLPYGKNFLKIIEQLCQSSTLYYLFMYLTVSFRLHALSKQALFQLICRYSPMTALQYVFDKYF